MCVRARARLGGFKVGNARVAVRSVAACVSPCSWFGVVVGSVKLMIPVIRVMVVVCCVCAFLGL